MEHASPATSKRKRRLTEKSKLPTVLALAAVTHMCTLTASGPAVATYLETAPLHDVDEQMPAEDEPDCEETPRRTKRLCRHQSPIVAPPTSPASSTGEPLLPSYITHSPGCAKQHTSCCAGSSTELDTLCLVAASQLHNSAEAEQEVLEILSGAYMAACASKSAAPSPVSHAGSASPGSASSTASWTAAHCTACSC